MPQFDVWNAWKKNNPHTCDHYHLIQDQIWDDSQLSHLHHMKYFIWSGGHASPSTDKTSVRKIGDVVQRCPSTPRSNTLTVPKAAIELHPKTNAHNPVGEGVESHHASHNGRSEVFQDNIIGVLITRHHLGESSSNIQSHSMLFASANNCKVE